MSRSALRFEKWLMMSIMSMICPSCGAPVQMPPGRSICFCEYCGGQVKLQLSESEAANEGKHREFMDTIKAAIHCVRSKDYETAQSYAEKAALLEKNDPAPLMIKYIALLDSDQNKASSALSIAKSMRMEGSSIALSDSEYKGVLGMFVYNYLGEREVDLKRVFSTIRGAKAWDIQNVYNYECRRRLDYYYTDPELKESFETTAEEYLKECEEGYRLTNEMSQTNWNTIKQIRDTQLFKLVAVVFANKSLAPRVKTYVGKYGTALDQKWEAAFKKSGVDGSKDQVRNYRNECSAVLSWLK